MLGDVVQNTPMYPMCTLVHAATMMIVESAVGAIYGFACAVEASRAP